MPMNDNAVKVLEKRYLTRDVNGKIIETIDEMFRRVAGAVARADVQYAPDADISQTEDAFYEMMTQLDFLPNSPTLMNAGKELGQLSACFVLPVPDSIEGIFAAVGQAALIHKSGGGTGFSFSRLRPRGSAVKSTGGVASGPVSFMKVFNAATEAVKQGGTRRGANMGILRVDHPDIMEFIDCKAEDQTITNFNISVAITEDFMRAVRAGADYALIDPTTKEIVKMMSARTVFDKIVDAAWRNGEPGIVFLDRMNRDNAVPGRGEIESTNPCGEQPLLPYESCNLGSINLMNMLMKTDAGWAVDYEKLGKTVDLAVHFLDNVIDINRYPMDIIAENTRATRKIGLGVMGFADMLLRLQIPYNSEEGVALAEELMRFIDDRGHAMSRTLAKTRGAFPLFSESVFKQDEPIRNATVTTIAPTGTLSILSGVSSGVEPVFAFAFVRNIMDSTMMPESNPILREALEARGLYTDKIVARIVKEGTLSHIRALPEDVRRVFVSAHDVSPEWHIRMQAAFQRHTDNAVSKTVNFVNEATREQVEQVYLLAWEQGLKGVTIYRDGSRSNQVLNIQKAEAAPESRVQAHPRPRPSVMRGITEQVKIGCGKLYVTVNYDEQGICEVFTNTGKHGGCPSQSEAVGRLTSLALRSGISIEEVIRQLKGIRCPSTIRQPGLSVLSCPDAIARVLERAQKEIDGVNQKPEAARTPVKEPLKAPSKDAPKGEGLCPECGKPIQHEGGCVICRSCGYSKCG